jgi:hypothetical protein
VVTQLRVYGRNARLVLSPAKRAFRLGAASEPEVDLTLDGDGVSRFHALLTRKGPKLRVADHNSTNGTYYRGRRDPDFEVGAGETFQVTQRITLVALDEDLANLRETLQWTLGLHADEAVDTALVAIAEDAPLLLTGLPGCDQRALAEAIHARSPRAARDLVTAPARFTTRQEEDAKLEHAKRGTLYLDLTGATEPLSYHFVTGLFSGQTRPIVVARDEEHAAQCLDTYARRLTTIRLPPLSARREDIARMLAALINQESTRQPTPAPALPLSALGAENLDAIAACDWIGNIDELRARAVPRLHAVLTNDLSLKRAALALGRKSITGLRQALARFGVDVRRAPGYSHAADDDADEVVAPAEASPVDQDADELPRPPPLREVPPHEDER